MDIQSLMEVCITLIQHKMKQKSGRDMVGC